MPAPEFEHLANAPIVEAVVDLRVGMATEGALNRIEGLAAGLAQPFPERRVLRAFEGRIHLQEDEPYLEKHSGSTLGIMVRSADARRFVQVKTSGFTFGHLRPYDSWETLFGEGWDLWLRYRSEVRPETVTRIATRFINRLSLPSRFETDEFFTTPLAVPAGVPAELASFNYSYVINAGRDTFANVRLASEPGSEGTEHSSVLLDIDCYVVRVRSPDDPSILEDMAKLRDLKNRIFFRTLTDKAKDLFR